MDRVKIGNYLTELRKKKGISQASLAEQIGVTFQAVSKWERGEAIPDIAILEALSQFYGITIDEIIKGEPMQALETEENALLKNSSPTAKTFLNSKRIYGFWISLGFILLFLLFSFCPFLNFGANYYQIIFSSNFLIGNFFFLIQFLITMSVPILTMVFCTCSNIKSLRKLYLARFILTIIMLISLITNIYYFELISIGNVFLMLLMIAYAILIFCLKYLKKSYIEQDFEE